MKIFISPILLGIATLLTGCGRDVGQQGEKWEYMIVLDNVNGVVDFVAGDKVTEMKIGAISASANLNVQQVAWLDRAGADGWELVDESGGRSLFKRHVIR